MMKRAFDLALSLGGLVVLAPLLLVLGAIIWSRDGCPVFFRQERVGKGGRNFKIWKFRTMQIEAERHGAQITRRGDARVTSLGIILRKWKLDELPQLLNVLVGEMSLVGPRPEVPRYVAYYTAAQRQVLHLRPGITDLATLRFRNEEKLLATAVDPEKFYREYCIPRKVALNLEYSTRASLISDIGLLIATVGAILAGDKGGTAGDSEV